MDTITTSTLIEMVRSLKATHPELLSDAAEAVRELFLEINELCNKTQKHPSSNELAKQGASLIQTLLMEELESVATGSVHCTDGLKVMLIGCAQLGRLVSGLGIYDHDRFRAKLTKVDEANAKLQKVLDAQIATFEHRN